MQRSNKPDILIRLTFLSKHLILFRSSKEPFSGIFMKISDCRAFSPFETVHDSLIRSVEFQSVDNRAKLQYVQARRIYPPKKQINFCNCFIFLNKHLILLRSLRELFKRSLSYVRREPRNGELAKMGSLQRSKRSDNK